MTKVFLSLLFLTIVSTTSALYGAITIENKNSIYLTQLGYQITLSGIDSTEHVLIIEDENIVQRINPDTLQIKSGQISLPAITFTRGGKYTFKNGSHSDEIRVIPGWLSLLPPLAAILLALLSKQVLIALFSGIWLGATFIYGYNPFYGFLMTLTEFIGKAPAEPDRMSIIIFSLVLGGMVGVISKSGGTQGIVSKLSAFASGRRSGQLSVWSMGILIFFDDYANTLIVGNTMRPLTDKLKISREKLAYLVDSTAAPVANIAIISTWIGYELSLINDSFQKIGYTENAYITFFKTIPFNYYPLFALVFGFLIAWMKRDMFSMYKAEVRACNNRGVLSENATPLADLNNSELEAKAGIPLRWYNGLIPVFLVIFTTLAGLWFTGLNNTNMQDIPSGMLQYISTVIGNSDSFSVLMWAAFIGSFAAIILALSQKLLSLHESISAWIGGVKAMVIAAIILTMAWAIGNICTSLQTADYVVYLTQDYLSPMLIPTISFLIAAVIAFSTGTSWGTMAILTPIVIPLAYQLPLADPAITTSTAYNIFLSAIASILAGATFGDHCSPISDTTIMSSMASGADHIDHVKTQLPYAVLVAALSILVGYLPVGLGVPVWLPLVSGIAAIVLIVRFMGKKVEG